MASGDGYSAPVWIEVDRIDTRPASEMRASIDEEALDSYAENFEKLPPVRVVRDADDKHWLADGSYRHRTAIRLGKTKIRAVIRSGTYLDAFAEASRANDAHGVPVRNADKRARILAALAHPVMGTWSQNKIAEHCAVNQATVSKYDSRSTYENHKLKTVGKDGKARRPRKAKPPPALPDISEPIKAFNEAAEFAAQAAEDAADSLAIASARVEESIPIEEFKSELGLEEEESDRVAPVPIPSRFDDDAEFERTSHWLDREMERWTEHHRPLFIMNLDLYIARHKTKYNITSSEVRHVS